MNRVLQGFSRFLSFLFHPLFIIIYVLLLFLTINPYLFPYRNSATFGIRLFKLLAPLVLFPLVAIFMMRALDLIESLEMKEKTDRIGPLIVTSIFYLWSFLNARTNDEIPQALTIFILGALISLFLSFFINNFSKISLHAVGLGGLLVGILNVMLLSNRAYAILNISESYTISIHNLFLLGVIIIVIGAVLSSRLYLKAHRLQDVAGGLLVGVLGQLIAIKIF